MSDKTSDTELRRAVVMREGYGMGWSRERAIQDTAEKFNVSVERVREIIEREDRERTPRKPFNYWPPSV